MKNFFHFQGNIFQIRTDLCDVGVSHECMTRPKPRHAWVKMGVLRSGMGQLLQRVGDRSGVLGSGRGCAGNGLDLGEDSRDGPDIG